MLLGVTGVVLVYASSHQPLVPPGVQQEVRQVPGRPGRQVTLQAVTSPTIPAEAAHRASPLVSVTLLESLHVRWVNLLESMTAADFERPLQHPERGPISLDWMLQMYAWHGRHHVAHVTSLRSREGW